MQKMKLLVAIALLGAAACNNDSQRVSDADSLNVAKRDSSVNQGVVTVDPESSSFLVRAADANAREAALAGWGSEHATIPEVKQFASMLQKEHTQQTNAIKQLAQVRNVTLPDSLERLLQSDVDNLQKKTGKAIDKEFVGTMIRHHRSSIDLYKDASGKVKDNEVRMHIDNSLPVLQRHLDSVQEIQKRYW
jgi:putative membrane protein